MKKRLGTMRTPKARATFLLASLILLVLTLAPTGVLAQSRGASVRNATRNSDSVTPDDMSGRRTRPTRRSSDPATTATAAQTPLSAAADVEEKAADPDASPTPAPRAPLALPTPNPILSGPSLADLDYKGFGSIKGARSRYPLNQPIQYVLEIRWNGRPAEVTVDAPANLTLANLSQTEPPAKTLHQGQNGQVAMLWTYRLQPLAEGGGSIGPVIVTARTKTRQALPVIHLPETEVSIGPKSLGWLPWVGIAVSVVLLLLLLAWALQVVFAVLRHKQYQEAMRESLPSMDERLLGEVDTLEVSLLRANLTGYYQKIALLTRQLLRGRGFLERADTVETEVSGQLRASGADKGYIASVESILSRCDAALSGAEKPDEDARKQIAEDLKQLIREGVFSPRAQAKLDEEAAAKKETP